ncbi:hypothetical protein NUM3379_18650 [Kineococcus sp. NUM-3379]
MIGVYFLAFSNPERELPDDPFTPYRQGGRTSTSVGRGTGPVGPHVLAVSGDHDALPHAHGEPRRSWGHAARQSR